MRHSIHQPTRREVLAMSLVAGASSISLTDWIRRNPDRLHGELTLRFTVDPWEEGAKATEPEHGLLKAITIALF